MGEQPLCIVLAFDGSFPTDTGGGAAVVPTPAKWPQSHGRSVDNIKRTRPTFERQSSQFLCLYDCPSLRFARTSRSLDLYPRICADLSIYARIYAKLYTRIYAKLNALITGHGHVRFR